MPDDHARRLALVALVALGGCNSAPAADVVPFHLHEERARMMGTWRWHLVSHPTGAIASNDATATPEAPAATDVLEDELWTIAPVAGGQVAAAYLRTVTVVSPTGEPFRCNQRRWYRQRSLYQLTTTLSPAGIRLREVGVRTEPSPCDAGFRAQVTYGARRERRMLHLTSGDGEQTLWPAGDTVAATATPRLVVEVDGTVATPWATPLATDLVGTWRWQVDSTGDDFGTRHEDETWTIQAQGDRLTGHHDRVVTSGAGRVERGPCAPGAGARRDRVELAGVREGDHWRLRETSSTPLPGSCEPAPEGRILDDAVTERIGDYLVLRWRGNRRQVLYAAD